MVVSIYSNSKVFVQKLHEFEQNCVGFFFIMLINLNHTKIGFFIRSWTF